ncbi:MAG: FAD-dependent oxidoreductase [Myxococcaceae bacterium]|nr:FAD-dependent oxidoreductase [Myxococcaceae bacterium]
MGMSIALELAARGDRVTVLEKAVPGAEASSAAAGMLAPQLEAHGAGPALTLGLESRKLYPAWVRRIEQLAGSGTGYRECGVLRFGPPEALAPVYRWQRELGLNVEQRDGALFFPDDHQVEPPRLMRALAGAAAKAGAQVRSGQVHEILPHAVDLGTERLEADAVVVAAGSWTSLVKGARVSPRALQPVRGQLVELHCRLSPFDETRTDGTVYLVSRGDGRVVCGSTMERTGFDKRVTASGIAGILNRAIALAPQLEHAELHSSWAGLRPWTEDELPIIGEGPMPGVHLATGHFRNGILLAPITAALISRRLHGEATGVDINPFRFDRFPT